jgi:tetratricopeptide (TPR) repeat protein
MADKPVTSTYIYSLLDAGQLTTALDITRQAIHAIREKTKWQLYELTPLSSDGADEVCPISSVSASRQVAAAHKSISRITALFAELHTELCLDDAETLAREAIELGRADAPASAFRCLGRLEARRHRHTEAERHFADALVRARDDCDSAERIRIWRELAIARSQSTQPVEAIQPAEDAVALASSVDKLRPLIDGALWAQGIALHASNRLEEADRVLLKAAQTAAESGHVLRVAWADHARANVLLDAGRNSHGVDLALRAMDQFVQIRHRYGIARCRLLIAQALNAEGKPQEAALAYEDAIGTLRTCDDKWREATAMRALAETLIDAQPKRTIEIARLLTGASTIFRRLGDFAAVKDTQSIMNHLEGSR